MSPARRREGVIFGPKVTRHSWGADPMRVVSVAIVDLGDGPVGRVFGVENGIAVELERAEGAEARVIPRPVRVLHADGEWPIVGVGCSCNVPAQLKGLNPLAVPSA